jgi:hypothetical protein
VRLEDNKSCFWGCCAGEESEGREDDGLGGEGSFRGAEGGGKT